MPGPLDDEFKTFSDTRDVKHAIFLLIIDMTKMLCIPGEFMFNVSCFNI